MKSGTSPSSPVLLYHRLGSPLVRSRVRGQYVLPALFRWQMKSILGRTWQAAAVSDLLALPEGSTRHFGITFDDGYASVGKFARQILIELNIPATIFVVVGAIGGSNTWDTRTGDRPEPILSLQELQDMASAGLEVGSHSMTHALLTEVSDAALAAEVSDSKHMLEGLLGRPVVGFSYPYGAVDDRVREAVIQAGYQYAAATNLSVITADVNRFAIPRINVRWNAAGPLFWRKIGRAFSAVEEGKYAHP